MPCYFHIKTVILLIDEVLRRAMINNRIFKYYAHLFFALLISSSISGVCNAEQELRRIDAALTDLETFGTHGVDYSIWLGPASGPAWYQRNTNTVVPAASTIKSAIAIEFFADQFATLDEPIAAIESIITNPDSAAIQHFDEAGKLEARAELPHLTARQLVEAMLHKKHVSSNAAYNAAANVIIEYLGGPAAATRRIHERFAFADDLLIARYMLADRTPDHDNLLTADALAAVHQHLASGGDDQLMTAVRNAMRLSTDPVSGEHYYKGGSLSSVPQVRIEAGWWEQNGQAAVYVLAATRNSEGGGTDSFENMKAELAELSSLVQTIGIRIRDAQTKENSDRKIHRQAYFGDLHIHTGNSSDSYMFKVRATPDDAYRYAKGFPIEHALGFPFKLRGPPLDFAAVTDHGELLGVLPAMTDPENPISTQPLAIDIRSDDRKKAVAAFFRMIQENGEQDGTLPLEYVDVIRSAWQETIEAAERYNQPGEFTTFVAYEYTSSPENQNLHRNVIFKSEQVPDIPFSSANSDNPEDLWRWLDGLRNQGMDALAIPHNSNVSNGLMFDRTNWSGSELDEDYAAMRMRNEPLVEVTQVKGTSETHPLLSPNDEWAGFELYDTLIASKVVAEKSGGFVREAYRRGIEFEISSGFNPYKFGLIGSSDTHNAGGSYSEVNYHSKAGALDGTAELRGTIPGARTHSFGADDAATAFRQWGASGLAGVWAEENTRESLYQAMQRKETFATSGPRIRVRLFAGHDYDLDVLSSPDLVQIAYRNGVAMGSDLTARADRKPSFLLWAVQDPNSARLQRLQVVKGWIANGVSHEAVFDVACSDGLAPDPMNHRCPDNGAIVNLDTCEPDDDKGAVEIKALWQDPTFDARQHAFYYLRALENPTCRWSTWDALRAGAPPVSGVEVTIQERAWSSPIWITPQL